MQVHLKSENGAAKEASFADMEAAARYCLENPEMGITLYPEGDEAEWDRQEWQATLDYLM